jgi:hypothetical protein
MILDVGNVERIENPSAEQVRLCLRLMPPEAPFVILSVPDEHPAMTRARDAGTMRDSPHFGACGPRISTTFGGAAESAVFFTSASCSKAAFSSARA